MKYGIQAKTESGDISFCTSTRGHTFAADMDDIALFVQKTSAEKAIKELRKSDYERDHQVTLSVVAVSMVVDAEFDVPYPKQQTGYIVRGEKHNEYHKRHYTVFFGGPKKQGSDVQWTESYSAATIFPDEFSAQQRINDSKQEAIQHIAYREKEAQDYSYRGKYLFNDSESEQKRRNQYNQDEIARAKQAVEWHDHVTIELITR